MSDLVWADPPSPRHKWTDVVEQLRERPGQWAIIDEREVEKGRHLSKTVARLKLQGCEATIRSSDGIRRLYARWPEESA